MTKKYTTPVMLTHDQAMQIAFALNGAAKIFEGHIETIAACDQTKLVWERAAEKHYTLRRYITDHFGS